MFEAALTMLSLPGFPRESDGALRPPRLLAILPQGGGDFASGTGDICGCHLLSLQVSVSTSLPQRGLS